jgi:hypothetical protein
MAGQDADKSLGPWEALHCLPASAFSKPGLFRFIFKTVSAD